MTDKINDGGPAFPVPDVFRPDGVHAAGGSLGMTLRDWFAGQALVAAWGALDKGYYEGGNHDIARCAYQIADAMLSEREAKP